ncbi:hypothetical protein EDB19DRAFT_1697035 [Suillus lakei]|nr:hypothetical protein EDB19DRAFT_1697035 [Suillus lakei]
MTSANHSLSYTHGNLAIEKERPSSFDTKVCLGETTTAMEPTEDYSFPPASFKPLLTEISGLLRSTSSTLAVAETTTGGLVSAALLSVSGASKFFVGGATVYTTNSRRAWAGWTDENLVNYRGPTPELVTELAVNVREQMDVTYCIGESGATGPTVPGPPFVHVWASLFLQSLMTQC